MTSPTEAPRTLSELNRLAEQIGARVVTNEALEFLTAAALPANKPEPSVQAQPAAQTSEPQTEAGRALDSAGGWYDEVGTYVRCTDLTSAIRNIEAEAQRLTVERLRKALKAEFIHNGSYNRTAVWMGIDRVIAAYAEARADRVSEGAQALD